MGINWCLPYIKSRFASQPGIFKEWALRVALRWKELNELSLKNV